MKLANKNNEANKLLFEFEKIDRKLDKAELVCTKTDGTKYKFNTFALPLKFIKKIHNYEIILDEAIEEQKLINNLNGYGPRIKKKEEEKNRVLESARKLFYARDDIIDLFEKGILPYKDNAFKTKEKKNRRRIRKKQIRKKKRWL